MDLIKNWKLHLLALIVVIVAESIGMHRFGLVVLLPLLYALVLGGILSFPKFGILKFSEMDRAAKFMPIAMLVLLTKIGLGIGPNLEMLLNSGWALIMQEFGHFFGTLIFGLPVALLLGMKREAIGACYSIDREPNVAIIGEKYGLDSPEGRGVMGMYICGTVFGALWISILAGVVAGLDIFHPHSLAMGAGIGSASMMAAGTGSIIAAYPEAAETVGAYAAAANLMTSVLGIYFALFISLPVTVKIYEFVTGDKRAASEPPEHTAPNMSKGKNIMNAIAAHLEKLKDYIFILLVTGIYTLVANTFGYNGGIAQGAVGILIIVAIAFFGVVIQMLPGFNKLPVVFWVSLTAVIVSIPSFPGGVWIVEQTKHINFLATTTPILAYGGLCLGKDLEAFKRLSWRIVPVAMAVASGSFLCATALAELMLHLEGIF